MKFFLTLFFPVVAIFFPLSVTGEELPPGCYVTFNQPNTCFSPSSSSLSWNRPKDSSDSEFAYLVNKYGGAVAIMIWSNAGTIYNLNQCNEAISDTNITHNELVSKHNALLETYDSLHEFAVKRQKIIRKLRKKIKKLKNS